MGAPQVISAGTRGCKQEKPMVDRIKQIVKYVAYFLFAGVLWGLFMYFVYTWLAGYSLLIAYLGNFLLIIVALIADEASFKIFEKAMESEEHLDVLRNDRFFQFFLDSYISFKAILYLFYIFTMVFSQIIDYYPTLVHENLASFIIANEYSILLLVAVDLFSGQFTNDKQRRRELFENFKKHLAEKVMDK